MNGEKTPTKMNGDNDINRIISDALKEINSLGGELSEQFINYVEGKTNDLSTEVDQIISRLDQQGINIDSIRKHLLDAYKEFEQKETLRTWIKKAYSELQDQGYEDPTKQLIDLLLSDQIGHIADCGDETKRVISRIDREEIIGMLLEDFLYKEK